MENKNNKPSFLAADAISEDNYTKLMIPNEPFRFEPKDIERILVHAVNNGVSDISVQSYLPIIYQIYGKVFNVSKHTLELAEMQNFITHIFGEAGVTTLNGGLPLNKSYFFRDEADYEKTYRFRVNATKGEYKGAATYQITARVIPSNIPYMSDMQLPEDLAFNLLNFSKGIALITGATGSGKSTLLASIIAEFLRDPKYHKKIITAEEPIEFTYESIKSEHSFVAQSAIPNDLPSFAIATANALRRAPNIILIGESRDQETIREATVAAMTGHEVYTTVHSNGFMDTFRRMIDVFPESEKPGAASALISNTKIVLSQRLVPSTDGKRVALREYVILNDEIREILLLGGPDKLTYTCKKVLDKYGHSFAQDAEEKFKAGKISQEIYNSILMGVRSNKGEEDNALKENMEIEVLNLIKNMTKKLEEQTYINNLLINKLFTQEEKINSFKFLCDVTFNNQETKKEETKNKEDFEL